MHFQKQYVYKPVKVYESSVLILIQALIMNIMNGSVPSWRKKAYDAGDRESKKLLAGSMTSSLFSPTVLVNSSFITY